MIRNDMMAKPTKAPPPASSGRALDGFAIMCSPSSQTLGSLFSNPIMHGRRKAMRIARWTTLITKRTQEVFCFQQMM